MRIVKLIDGSTADHVHRGPDTAMPCGQNPHAASGSKAALDRTTARLCLDPPLAMSDCRSVSFRPYMSGVRVE